MKTPEWLKAQEENQPKPAASNTNNHLPPIQKTHFEPAPASYQASDLKISDLDLLEPDGCVDHPEEDHHEIDKHNRELNQGKCDVVIDYR